MVQSPVDCSRLRGRAQSQSWLRRMRWAPLSTVATPSAGKARRAAAMAAAGPQVPFLPAKISRKVRRTSAGAPFDQTACGPPSAPSAVSPAAMSPIQLWLA